MIFYGSLIIIILEMYKPYKTPVVEALPDVKIPEPRVSKFAVLVLRLLGKLYLFLFFGITRIAIPDGKNMYDAFKRALAGESRCIIAFRHPDGGEPQLLTWFFLFKLRRFAAKNGVSFVRLPHAVFVYTYEVVRWGGWPARFFMPNLGAMPIYHAKMDNSGMTRIYNAISSGQYPVALAPEGQVSYTTEAVPRLEPGVIRIGFHNAERLEAKGENCPVEILPVAVYFRFGSWGKLTVEKLIRKIEKVCGFNRGENLSVFERVQRCRDFILEVNEDRYQIKKDETLPFEKRLENVIYAALETGERILGLKADGDYFNRMYKLRQCCWDNIVLPGVSSFEGMPPIERSVKDLKAGEAWLAGRHQELVDFGWYFRVPMITRESTFHYQIEYVQNLWDFANRTMGGGFSDRVSIFPRSAVIQAAPVINLSERLSTYKKDKKAAVAEALSDLEKAYLGCIAEAGKTADKNSL